MRRVQTIDGLFGMGAIGATAVAAKSGATFALMNPGQVASDINSWREGQPPPAQGVQPGQSAKPPSGGGWPAPETPDPQWWKEDPTIPSGWGYRVHYGVTLSGLAATFLGMPERVKELWAAQPSHIRDKYTMSAIPVGTVLWMPAEAVERGRALGVVPRLGKSTKRILLIAGGAVAVVGIGTAIWLVAR